MSIDLKESPINHLQRLQLLLRMEYEHEKEEFRRLTESVGISRKIKQGLCWSPVRVGKSYYNSLNQCVVEVFRGDECEEEHSFEYGRAVCFFYPKADGALHYLNFTATVSYVDESRMVLVMPSAKMVEEIRGVESLGVQLYFDETSYQTMFLALEQTIKAKGNRLSSLRDTLIGQVKPQFRDIFPMRLPWLNSSQEEAVDKVLRAKDVAVVHGPPGTGKTTTLVEAIYETLHREPQVLVCAQSNMAVDWISEKLVDRGVNVLRIGNPVKVNDKMLAFTYERRFESHELYPELWGIRKEMRRLTSQRKSDRAERDAVRNRLSKLRERAYTLEYQINTELFDSAHVIASTLVSSNHRLLDRYHFGTLFIDEAAQAMEAACWIAIRKADRVVFAGDHCQLPPTVKCYEAEKAGLSTTLMEQIVKRHKDAVNLLTTQYRMNEQIMHFSSQWFYGGNLKAANEVKCRGILDWDTPIEWVDTADLEMREEMVSDTNGRINKEEADLLLERLQAYVDKIGLERILEERIDFGIISPYKAQVHYLRHRLKKSSALQPLRKMISVNTVDGFQGQERDVIFISMVRANEQGNIGFLNDLRRMNVAITRARMKLVILGDANTLTRHPFYHRLHAYILSLRQQ